MLTTDNIIKKLNIKPIENSIPNVSEFKHGWLHNSNQRLLSRAIKTLKPKIVLELGTWLGTSTKFMLEQDPNLIIICVDHWKGGFTIKDNLENKDKLSYEDKKINDILKKDILYETFIKNIWKFRNRIIPFRIDGREAIKIISKNKIPIDLIYLDMDHEYEPVFNDLEIIEKYLPNINIIGDDLKFHEGVGKAVYKFLKNKKFKLELDQNSYWIHSKNNKKFSMSFFQKRILSIEKCDSSKNKNNGIIICTNNKVNIDKISEKINNCLIIWMCLNDRVNNNILYNYGAKIAIKNSCKNIILHSPNLVLDEYRYKLLNNYCKYPIFLSQLNTFYNHDSYEDNGEIVSIPIDIFKKIDGLGNYCPLNKVGYFFKKKLQYYNVPFYIPSKGDFIKRYNLKNERFRSLNSKQKNNFLNFKNYFHKKKGTENININKFLSGLSNKKMYNNKISTKKIELKNNNKCIKVMIKF